jgi:thiamine biosynthesis lipoprotein
LGTFIFCGFSVLLAPLALASTAVAGEEELKRYESMQRHMGTDVQIILYAASHEQAEAAFLAGFARIEQLERVLSDYDRDSEASRLSQSSPMADPVPVSKDLWQALRVSVFVSRKSGGAFDVTIGPLSRLWRRAHRQGELPSSERLDAACDAVGYRLLRFDPGRQAVQLPRPGMRLDFGGIGKGMAADLALKEIRSKGIRSALVDSGGDMAIGDAPPGTAGWRVGVAGLDPDRAERVVQLANVGIATSGDAHQYVQIEGTRYSHIVDPGTGIGLTIRSSVTVIAADGTLADAVASAVSVLGPRRGTRLVRHWRGVEVQVLSLKDGVLVRHTTPGFPERTAAEPCSCR